MFLQENVCLTLLPKNAHGITQRPTLFVRNLRNDKPFICHKRKMGTDQPINPLYTGYP